MLDEQNAYQTLASRLAEVEEKLRRDVKSQIQYLVNWLGIPVDKIKLGIRIADACEQDDIRIRVEISVTL